MQRVTLHGVFKGKSSLSEEAIESLYGESRHISYGELNDQFRPLNDLFAMAEGCLIADAIEQFERKRDSYGELYSPAAVVDDVQAAIGEVHRSGAMHNRYLLSVMQCIIRFCID
jgi:hypothetical protein